MAVHNFYPLNSLQAGTGFQALQQNGTAPADAVHTAGWIMSNTAAGNSAELDANAERAANQMSSDTTTPKPLVPDNTLGNGFVIPTALTGEFAAGNWTLQLVSRSVTAVWTNGVIAYKWRVYKSAAQTGTSPTEITSGIQQSANSPAFAVLATNYTTTLTWAAPSFQVNNEFLIFTLACRVQTAATGTGTTRDVNLRVNPASIITTTDLGAIVDPIVVRPARVQDIYY